MDLTNGQWTKARGEPPTDKKHSIAILGGLSKDREAFKKGRGYCWYVTKHGGFRMMNSKGRQVKMTFGSSILNTICDYIEEKEYVHCVDLTNGGHWRYPLRDLFY